MIDLSAPVNLLLGDCLNLLPEIPNKSIDAIFCDLPYGTTDCPWDSVIDLTKLWKEYKRIIKPRGAIVLNAAPPFTFTLGASNLPWYKHSWIWDKRISGNPFLAKYAPMRVTEDVLVFGRPSGAVNYYPKMSTGPMKRRGGGSAKSGAAVGGVKTFKVSYSDQYYPKNIISIPNSRRGSGRKHQTEKPVPLFRYFMETYSKPGDLVLDNCFGSGASGVAAVELERRYLGMERDEDWFEYGSDRIARIVEGARETVEAEEAEQIIELRRAA